MIGRKEFFNEIRDIHKTNQAYERRIDTIENRIYNIITDYNKLTKFISAYARKMVNRNDKTKY